MPLTGPQAQIASAAINTATGFFGMFGQRKREQRSLNNQRKLMALQYANQRKLNEQGQELEIKTWRDTNYAAQIAMMKEAGLNPALLYGQGGGPGGITGKGQSGSAAGGQAPAPQPMNMMDINAALKMAAEIQLIKAQAENVEANTDKTRGVDTELAESTIAKLIAETTNEGLKARLNELNIDLLELEKVYRPHQLQSEIFQTIASANKIILETDILDEQKDDLIKEVKQRVILQQIEMSLKKEQVNLTQAQQDKLRNDIAQGWESLSYLSDDVNTRQGQLEETKFYNDIQAFLANLQMNNASKVAGALARDVYETVRFLDDKIIRKREPVQTKVERK